MSKLIDNLDLEGFYSDRQKGEKAVEQVKKILDKDNLSPEDIDLLIVAGNFADTDKFIDADDIINNRLAEVFSVMAFAAESSERWKSILNDEKAKLDFNKTYRKGAAEAYRRKLKNI